MSRLIDGRSSRPIVVKLGGSLFESKRLDSILDLVAKARRRFVIVPGGGSFADAVRDAQTERHFSDAVAHRMALLAMHQTGLMLAERNARLQPTETIAGMTKALTRGAIPIWLPYKLTAADPRVPADWTATSDALSARLAERLGRAPVVLVKSCRVPASASLAALTHAGIVDTAFGAIVTRANLPWSVLGAGDEPALSAMLEVRSAGLALNSRGHAHRREGTERAIARRR